MSQSLPCRSKQALLRGLRPSSTTTHNIHSSTCHHCCIYCDIWNLATLIASLISSTSPPSSPTSSPTSSRPSSPMDPISRHTRLLSAQFQTQRARLASIISICTVAGAEESDGLRLAHDRCLASVLELMRQQEVLREQQEVYAEFEHSRDLEREREQERYQYRQQSPRPSRGCAEQRQSGYYYLDERRTSMAGLAM